MVFDTLSDNFVVTMPVGQLIKPHPTLFYIKDFEIQDYTKTSNKTSNWPVGLVSLVLSES